MGLLVLFVCCTAVTFLAFRPAVNARFAVVHRSRYLSELHASRPSSSFLVESLTMASHQEPGSYRESTLVQLRVKFSDCVLHVPFLPAETAYELEQFFNSAADADSQVFLSDLRPSPNMSMARLMFSTDGASIRFKAVGYLLADSCAFDSFEDLYDS